MSRSGAAGAAGSHWPDSVVEHLETLDADWHVEAVNGRRGGPRGDATAEGELRPGRRLVLVVLIVCVLLVTASALLAQAWYRQSRDSVIAGSEMRSRISAMSEYGIRVGLRQLLQALAADPALQHGDVKAVRSRLRTFNVETFGFTGGLTWLDPQGHALVSTGGREGVTIGDRWLHDVVTTGVWTTSGAGTSPVFSGEVLVFAVPTTDADGVTNGVLAAGLGIDWLRTHAAEQIGDLGEGFYGPNTSLLIVDRDGRLIVGPGLERTRDVSATPTYRRIMEDRSRLGHGALVGVRGLTGAPNRLVSYSGTGSFGETIVLERPLDDALAGPHLLLWLPLTGMLLLAGIALAGASQVGRRLDRLARERDELYRAEHDVVVDLQRSLLTAHLPRGAVARYLPAASVLNVGGDWYDAIPLPEDRLLLVVGDVVGHGVRAALAMGEVRTATRALAARLSGPGDLLGELDRYVAGMADIVFCTAVCILVDMRTGELRYAAGGHPPCLLRRPDGTVERFDDVGGAPLGLGNGSRPESLTRIEPGAVLIAYTDGLVERRGESIDAGIDRLVTAVVGDHRKPGDDASCRLLIAQALADATPAEDILLLSFRFEGAPVPVT